MADSFGNATFQHSSQVASDDIEAVLCVIDTMFEGSVSRGRVLRHFYAERIFIAVILAG